MRRNYICSDAFPGASGMFLRSTRVVNQALWAHWPINKSLLSALLFTLRWSMAQRSDFPQNKSCDRNRTLWHSVCPLNTYYMEGWEQKSPIVLSVIAVINMVTQHNISQKWNIFIVWLLILHLSCPALQSCLSSISTVVYPIPVLSDHHPATAAQEFHSVSRNSRDKHQTNRYLV